MSDTYPAMKLGKLPPKIDARTLKLSSYLSVTALPPIPAASDWTKKVSSWGVMMNDQLGDCAIASPGHAIMAMSSNSLGKPDVVTDAEVVAAYSAITGYVPGNPSTDNGTVMLDMLKYWQQVGIANNKTAAYVSIDPKDPAQIRAGIHLFGGVQFGVQLPKAAQAQVDAGQPWTGPIDPRQARGQWAPGSWGGHAIPGLKYDDKGVYVVTWGKIQLMTWTFIADYADEAYVVVDPEWFAPDGVSPSGIDLWTLWNDLMAVTDGKLPIPAPPQRPTPVPVTPPAPVPVVPPVPVPTKITVLFTVDPVTRSVSVSSVS